MGNPRIDAGVIAILLGVFSIAISYNNIGPALFGVLFLAIGGWLLFTDGKPKS